MAKLVKPLSRPLILIKTVDGKSRGKFEYHFSKYGWLVQSPTETRMS